MEERERAALASVEAFSAADDRANMDHYYDQLVIYKLYMDPRVPRIVCRSGIDRCLDL